MAAPTAVAEVHLAEGTGTRAFASALTTQAGDWIEVMVGGEDGALANVTPSATGLTFTLQQNTGAGGDARIQHWTAPDAAGGSRTITMTASVAGRNYRATATTVRGSGGPGTGKAGAIQVQTVSGTRQAANSMIFMVVVDWNTGAVGSPAWTPGGTTRASQQGSAATYLIGRWDDSGAAGTAAHGISSPSYGRPSVAWLEMLGSAGISANLGRVTVAETARTLSSSKVYAIGRVTSVQTARTLAARKGVAINRVSEISVARAAGRQKAVSAARVTVVETARTLGRLKVAALGRVSTIETARTLAKTRAYLLGRATETSVAQTLTTEGDTFGFLTRVSVAETARSFSVAKTKALARIVTTEQARTLTRTKAKILARVASAETARTVTAGKRQAFNRVLETASARTLTTTVPQPPGDAGPVWGVDMGLR